MSTEEEKDASTQSGSDETEKKLRQSPLVDRLRADPAKQPVPIIKLIGILGKDVDPTFVRVYFSPTLDHYMRVAREDIVDVLDDDPAAAAGSRIVCVHRGGGSLSCGWRPLPPSEGELVVTKNGLSLVASAAALVATKQVTVPADTIRVRQPKEFRCMSPGFYIAVGDAEWDDDCVSPARFYFNITEDGAQQLMRHATMLLNAAKIPFRLKVLDDPAQYTRCDAAVLYIQDAHIMLMPRMLCELLPFVIQELKEPVPGFTRRLKRGIGFAEDPGTGESFGQNRCRLLSEAIIRAREMRRTSLSRRLSIIADHFINNHVDPTHPYLRGLAADRPPFRLGLYTGMPGIAYALARVGRLLDDEELLEEATKLVISCQQDTPGNMECDLLSGVAGAIVGFLLLRKYLPNGGLLETAETWGKHLVSHAVRTEEGMSWKSTDGSHLRNLTGLSHGTAGVAYALLDLFEATKETIYLDVAQQALQYERHWFDKNMGNWRNFVREPGRNPRTKSFRTFWCHGAPGIALSLIKASTIYNHDVYHTEAQVALDTTRRSIESDLRRGTGNFSLCHGLTGNAEVLLWGDAISDNGMAKGRAVAYEVASHGLHRYRYKTWPCGTIGETPGLMLGLAGIGLFYLRLCRPQTPSAIVFGRSLDMC